MATVKLAVQTELRSDSPKITSQQLKDGWKIPDPDLLRLGRLLAAEPSVWSGTFSGPDAPGVWSMGVGRDIRRFRDVNSVDELVAALPPLPTMPIFSKPNPTIQ